MVIFALFSAVSWRPYIAPKEEWYRKWKPTPVFLPGKSHGQRSLVGYSSWSHKDWDTTEQAHIDVHILIPRTCEYVSFHGRRGHADVSKDPEIERQFWIIWMGTMSSQGSLQVEEKVRRDRQRSGSDNRIRVRASLVLQWLRICLPMQRTWVQSLVQEDPTCLQNH